MLRVLRTEVPRLFTVARSMADPWVNYAKNRSDPLIPPPWLHNIGPGDYRRAGEEMFGHFVELGGLKPTHRVLDVGCGTGRMAIPLTSYLTTGTYDGFDIVERSIRWCEKAYSPFPNFRFHFADLDNSRYNNGSVAAEQYRFPFPDRAFDFVFLTSVFTHMKPKDVAHYLREIRRVLAPGGRVFLTAFLLDEKTLGLIASGAAYHSFRHQIGNGSYADKHSVPEAAIAYKIETLTALIRDAGLSITRTELGSWRGTPGIMWQDVLISELPDRPN